MKLFIQLLPFYIFVASLCFSARIEASIPFQQRANITIHAELIDSLRTLIATQAIEYQNNSPDTLRDIYMHLWANAWKNNRSALAKQFIANGDLDFHFAADHERGGYSSIEFSTNGKKLNWGDYAGHQDIAVLYLDKPLLPGNQLVINIKYRLIFPDARFSRLGHDNDAFYATQWYPKPAVYDQNGWNPMPYLHRGEFFSEFGDYEVFITLPQNYVVASTGLLQTAEEIEFLNNLAIETHRNDQKANDPLTHHHPPSSTIKKTLHYKQSNIHDFAWFADKRFQLYRDSIELTDGQRVQLYAFFTHDAHLWQKANRYMAETIRYMSELLGTYPWQQMTAVQALNSGGANMEYPAITLIGKKNTDTDLEKVLVHETIHNWFYGILASNERKEPWIDEGFTSYYEMRYFSEKYPDRKLLGPLSNTVLAIFFQLSQIPESRAPYYYYMMKAALDLDQPPGSSSEELSELNYFFMAYYKAALAINMLEKHLGQDRFDSIMREFYNLYKFSHPTTKDISIFFHQQANTDLSWFFDGLIGSTGKTDLDLQKVRKSNEGFLLTVKNRGDFPIPFTITGFKENKPLQLKWVEGFSGRGEIFFEGTDFDYFTIDSEEIIPEIRRVNNSRQTSGIFRKRLTLPELQFLAGIKNPEKPRVYWIPVLSYNVNDGFSPGLAFYNYAFPVQKNDIFLMPQYSSLRDDIAGTAWYYRDFYPKNNNIHSWRAGTKLKRYGLSHGSRPRSYSQLETSVKVVFTPERSSQRTETYIRLTNYLINRERLTYSGQQVATTTEKYYANRLNLVHGNQSVFNPYQFDLELLQADQMLRGSLTAKALFPANKKREGLHVRFFTGYFFLRPQSTSGPDFRLSLQGISPSRAIIFDQSYLGLNQPPGTFAGNQTFESHGDFKFPTPLGLTWNWLAAINLAYDIPFLPLRAYYDTGTYHRAAKDIIGTQQFPWVRGLQVILFKDIININLPLFASDDINRIAELNKLGNFLNRITYNVKLDRIDPLKARRRLHLLLN